jgi:hypothetical protein
VTDGVVVVVLGTVAQGEEEREEELSLVYYLIDAVTYPLLFIIPIGVGSQAKQGDPYRTQILLSTNQSLNFLS